MLIKNTQELGGLKGGGLVEINVLMFYFLNAKVVNTLMSFGQCTDI